MMFTLRLGSLCDEPESSVIVVHFARKGGQDAKPLNLCVIAPLR